MNLRKIVATAFSLAFLSAAQAHAAGVAVMPVRGLNLSQGESDAVGALFAAAFAREAHVEVIPPATTGPALAQGKTASAAAALLGATEFIELTAIRLAAKVTLAGIRSARDGSEIYRAETAAPSLDEMDAAATRLAYALAWNQPVPPAPAAKKSAQPPAAPASADADAGPKHYPKALGVKMGVGQPVALGRSFNSVALLAFDARFGPREYFVELAAGVTASAEAQNTYGKASLETLYAEVGGSVYLTEGSIAPYVGGGLSPRFAYIGGSGSEDGVKFAVYGQGGITFTRDSRFRLYGELRVSQNVLGIHEYSTDYTTTPSRTVLGTYYPTEIAMQGGVGW